MPFKAGNKHGAHGNHKSNFNPQQFSGNKWMMKDGQTLRVPKAEQEAKLKHGWTYGRPSPSDETRKRQSEAGKQAKNPGRFVSGHQTWNTGQTVSEDIRVLMSAGKLKKYGVSEEQIVIARAAGQAWCSEHLIFEPTEDFTILKNGVRSTRCNRCHKKYTPWYREQFLAQNCRCAICELEFERTLCVDHWHHCISIKHARKDAPQIGCECTRGLICTDCNIRVGQLEAMLDGMEGTPTFRDGSWHKKALDYLAKYPYNPVSGVFNGKN